MEFRASPDTPGDPGPVFSSFCVDQLQPSSIPAVDGMTKPFDIPGMSDLPAAWATCSQLSAAGAISSHWPAAPLCQGGLIVKSP